MILLRMILPGQYEQSSHAPEVIERPHEHNKQPFTSLEASTAWAPMRAHPLPAYLRMEHSILDEVGPRQHDFNPMRSLGAPHRFWRPCRWMSLVARSIGIAARSWTLGRARSATSTYVRDPHRPLCRPNVRFAAANQNHGVTLGRRCKATNLVQQVAVARMPGCRASCKLLVDMSGAFLASRRARRDDPLNHSRPVSEGYVGAPSMT